ncbi:F0F1 ATP synthase subunit alpha [Candidatus Uhrbacteria bacterium]|nr:F0F1 ATP synthase subunit alpha [Candidatus Uhrbacteria bacterium]
MQDAKQLIHIIEQKIASLTPKATKEEVGRVVEVGDGVARLTGLPSVRSMEMVEFFREGEAKPLGQGFALNLEEDTVGVVVLGDDKLIREGDTVRAMNRVLSIPVSRSIVGRVINPLGEPLDGKGPIVSDRFDPVEKIAPGVITRQAVNTPIQTGIKAIDGMIPIGRGQRELIIGDRQTGKTQVALDTIINQKGTGVTCIYVAIGQKESKVARIVAQLEEHGAMEHTVVVVAGASDPAPLWFMAPFSGATIGEFMMESGGDALVVYDDLSKHAWAYRQVSLLLRRPPGREAYPGDVFYLHSRLLERAARLNKENGGGSLTALPIIETQAGDVSAYIPTNVISITDGQIYLETDLFYKGVRPALNVGLSVSRVGSSAQTKAMKSVAGKLRLELAQFRELEAFAQFATDLDEETRKRIERGQRLTELLKQDQFKPMSVTNQVLSIFAGTNGYFDATPLADVREREQQMHAYVAANAPQVVKAITETGKLEEKTIDKLKEVLTEFNQQ